MAARIIDEYTLKTRLVPVLVTLLPYLYTIHSANMDVTAMIDSLLLSLIIIAILTSSVREIGAVKMDKLFGSWGGKPAVIMLRHRDKTLPPVIKERYHQALEHFSGHRLPTAAFEASNPADADAAYEVCVQWLMESTKDRHKYALLAQDAMSYGLWSNLLALKSIGMAVAVGSLLITAGAFILARLGLYAFDVRMLLAPVVSIITLWFWINFVKPRSVINASYAYARTLLSQCDTLMAPRP